MGIRVKLFLPLVLLSVLLFSYMYWHWMPKSIADTENTYLGSVRSHLDSIAEGLVPLLLGNQLDAVYGNLDALLMKNKDWVSIELLDPKGKLLYPLDASPASKEPAEHEFRVLKQEITYLDMNLGSIIVNTDLTLRLNEIKRQHIQLLRLFLIVMLLFLLTTGVVLEFVVRKPIKLLADASKRLALGDFDMPLPAPGAGVIGKLLNSFILMRDTLRRNEESIRKMNEELEQKVRERTSQLLEAQEELVRKEKLSILGQLAGSVGHELRNPLGVMNNAVYFLKSVMPDASGTVREYLNIIKSEIDSSQRIIGDLLGFARVKTPQTQAVPVQEIIRRSLDSCVIPDNVTIQTELPDTLPALQVDPLQMGQVFQNLIVNAVQAMPRGGSVRVSARRIADFGLRISDSTTGAKEPVIDNSAIRIPQSAIEISVTDTGEGIAPENKRKIFQPLFTTKGQGIGLGLVVTKRLTEANGGTIAVESQWGKGTTFALTLPVEEAPTWMQE